MSVNITEDTTYSPNHRVAAENSHQHKNTSSVFIFIRSFLNITFGYEKRRLSVDTKVRAEQEMDGRARGE